MRLQGKVAIVAGGGQGIGEGIVKCLAQEGADIAIVDINGKTASQAAEKVKAMGRKALPLAADLTDEKQVAKAVKDVADHFGKIDILVNNVGGSSENMALEMAQYGATRGEIGTLAPFLRFSPDMWDKFYELNLKTHVMLSQTVTPYFVKQRGGRIINISSTSGRMADPTNMPYAAMKAGDISFTWSLSKAVALFDITVNCVCPGFVYTPLWDRGATGYLTTARAAVRQAREKGDPASPALARYGADADLDKLTPKEFWLKYIVRPMTPNGREQTPEDMGWAVVFFASDEAKNVTGQVLHVDGGMITR